MKFGDRQEGNASKEIHGLFLALNSKQERMIYTIQKRSRQNVRKINK